MSSRCSSDKGAVSSTASLPSRSSSSARASSRAKAVSRTCTTGSRADGGVDAPTDEIPDVHLALPLDGDRPPRLAHELVVEQLLRGTRDLDPPRGPVRLHAASSVHGVAPEVVE